MVHLRPKQEREEHFCFEGKWMEGSACRYSERQAAYSINYSYEASIKRNILSLPLINNQKANLFRVKIKIFTTT